MTPRNIIDFFLVVIIIVIGVAIYDEIGDRREAEIRAEEYRLEVQRIDSIARADSIARVEAEQKYLQFVDSLRVQRERAQQVQDSLRKEREAATDTIRQIRERIDTLAMVDSATVNSLVAEYEGVIEQQDSVIANVSRVLYSERQAHRILLKAYTRSTAQSASLREAIQVRDERIAALEDQLGSGILPIPRGLKGDLAVVASVALVFLLR